MCDKSPRKKAPFMQQPSPVRVRRVVSRSDLAAGRPPIPHDARRDVHNLPNQPHHLPNQPHHQRPDADRFHMVPGRSPRVDSGKPNRGLQDAQYFARVNSRERSDPIVCPVDAAPRPFKVEVHSPKGRPRERDHDKDALAKTINKTKFYAGEQVLVKRTGRKLTGVVLAVLEHKIPVVYGVELRSPDGGGCGKRGNVRYFRCRDQCGVFVTEDALEKCPDASDAPPPTPFNLTEFEGFADIPGLEGPKEQLTSLWKMAKVAAYKDLMLRRPASSSPHTFIFAGPRGCGKTVIASKLGHVLRDIGCISKGNVHNLTTWDTEDAVEKAWESSEGCVLMVTDHDAEDSRCAGHIAQRVSKRWRSMPSKYLALIVSVPHETPPSRWKFLQGASTVIQFSAYHDSALVEIVRLMVTRMDFTLDPKITNEQLLMWIRSAQRSAGADCPNAHGCAHLIAEAMRRQSTRIYPLLNGAISGKVVRMLTRDDFESDANTHHGAKLKACLEQLNACIGLQEVKDVVTTMIHRAQWNMQRRLQGGGQDANHVGSALSRHMVFVGSPGTGKTTVARLLAEIFREMGELRIGHMVDTDRSGLVAPYVGQTAPMTKATVQKALGGILFIDEAYSLNMGDSSKKDTFGEEAVVQLLKMMEDQRDDLIVIIAGYTEGIDKLLDSNPGLKERFIQRVQFADFSTDELQAIGERMIREEGLKLSASGRAQFGTLMAELSAKRDANFSNARLVRNVVQKASDQLATRVAKGCEKGVQVDLNELVRSDFIGLKF